MNGPLQLSRRTLLGSAGALAGLAGLGLSPRAALAQGTALRAAITGYGVVNTLDPGKAALIPEFYLIWGIYNGLLKFDDTMQIVPDLAESYKALEGGAIAFKLREGVKFHDGSVLTADDVKFSLERLLDPAFASPNAAKVAAISKIEVVDDLNLVIHTKQAFAPLLTFLTNARTGTQILPRKAFEAAGAEAFARAPIGTGPYKLKSWETGGSLTLEAFEDHFAGAPAIKTVDVPLIVEEASGVTALLGGQIDMTSTVPTADVPQLMSNKDVTVLRQPGLNVRFISINLQKPPFDDVHFRRAVAMAFQREAMVKTILFGEGEPLHGFFPPLLGEVFTPGARPETSFDPAAAKAELAKSKYKADEHAVEVLTWGGGWWKRFAEIFVAQVNQVLGTRFTVQVTDSNAAFARQKSGDFTAGVWGWLGMIDADEYMGDIVHSGGWRNYGKYKNPAVDTLLENARAELDPAKRAAIYREAETLAIADVPIIPCFCSNIHNLVSKRVEGFVQKPYSNFGDQFAKMRLV
ncbi:ABC transporter substrate-binding protein [Gemmobacter sp.]|uniref:ABC transporter substrate-binding protein n=1 Tax=Gemmobacter sp. TaxID=1898957 RepID=UPI002AFE88B2|nr:ABC transporter substrate-binding protein [Gemmobacter sp.]